MERHCPVPHCTGPGFLSGPAHQFQPQFWAQPPPGPSWLLDLAVLALAASLPWPQLHTAQGKSRAGDQSRSSLGCTAKPEGFLPPCLPAPTILKAVGTVMCTQLLGRPGSEAHSAALKEVAVRQGSKEQSAAHSCGLPLPHARIGGPCAPTIGCPMPHLWRGCWAPFVP